MGSCACSCNSPADKMQTFETCFEHAKSAESGSYCLATLFTQLPPEFVHEALEYCIRPIQGHPGNFPSDFSKFQPLCQCFRKPEVMAECGPDEEVQASCIAAVRDHYVLHVRHQYCLHNTEAACEFACKWPLPGFFGDVAKQA